MSLRSVKTGRLFSLFHWFVTDEDDMAEPTRSVRVLLYEDLRQDAHRIVRALQGRVGLSLRVVWFKAEPGFRHGRKAALGRDVWTDSFPLTLKRDVVVEVFANGKWRRQAGGQWWQSDFDAAVLDVYEEGRIPAGENFARWLEHARFAGPVILASFHDLPASQFPQLPSMQMVNKHNDDWEEDVATRLYESLAPVGVRIVNAAGQNPDDTTCVRMFWEHVKELSPHRQPKRCRAFWYGDDHEFAKKILDALNHDVIAVKPLACVENGLLTDLKESRRTLRDPWPDFVWVDVGSKTIELKTWLERLTLGTELPSPRPVVVLVADRTEGLSASVETELTRQGIVCLRRAEIGQPGRWAVDTVDLFLSNLAIAKQSLAGVNRSKDTKNRVDAAEKLFRAYMRVLLIAQRQYYVSGNKTHRRPSVLRWLGPYPISGTLANTGLEKIGHHWALLAQEHRVHPHVMARFRRES
jgi:hypothetical protein